MKVRILVVFLLFLLFLPSVFAQEVLINVKPVKPIIYVNEIAEYAVSITTLKEPVSLVVKSPTGFWEISTKESLEVGLDGLDTILYLKPINSKTGEQIVPVEFKEKNKPFKTVKEIAVNIIPDIKLEEYPAITGSISKKGQYYNVILKNEKNFHLTDVNLRLLFKEGLSNTNLKLEALEKKFLLLNISEQNTLAKAIVIINYEGNVYKFDIPIERTSSEENPTIITPQFSDSKTAPLISGFGVLDFSKNVITPIFKSSKYLLIFFVIMLIVYTSVMYVSETKKIIQNSKNKLTNIYLILEEILLNFIAIIIILFKKLFKKLGRTYNQTTTFFKTKIVKPRLLSLPKLNGAYLSLPRINLPRLSLNKKITNNTVFLINSVQKKLFRRHLKFKNRVTQVPIKINSNNLKLHKKIRFSSRTNSKFVKVFLTFENLSKHTITSIKVLDLIPKNYELIETKRTSFRKNTEQGIALVWQEKQALLPNQNLKFEYAIAFKKNKTFTDLRKNRELNLPIAKAIIQINKSEEKVYSEEINLTF